MKDIGLKIFSLAVALFLFLIANSQINQSVLTRSVPIEIQNIPPNRMVILPKALQATVTMKGPSILIKDSAVSSLRFIHALPSDVGNTYTLILREEELQLPAGIEIVAIQPDLIELILDRVVEKKVPVEVTRIGHISDNVRLEKVEVTPPDVTIRGPETELDSINIIETQPIDFREIEESVTLTRNLRAPAIYAKASVKSVNVRIEVTNIEIEKRFTRVPVEIRSSGKNALRVNPAEVDVEISGPRRAVRNLSSEDIVPFVRVADPVSRVVKKVEINLPANVKLVQIEPSSVTLIDATADGRRNEGASPPAEGAADKSN